MTTTFEVWQRELAAAGNLVPDGIRIDRALAYNWEFALEGDWTGATAASALRVQPDAGSPLPQTFTITNDGYDAVNAITLFTMTMSATDTAALPADPSGEAVVRLAWDVLLTPDGEDEFRLMGGIATVIGEVTDA